MWGFLVFCTLFYWLLWPRVKPWFKNQIAWIKYMRDNTPPKTTTTAKVESATSATLPFPPPPAGHGYSNGVHASRGVSRGTFNPNSVPGHTSGTRAAETLPIIVGHASEGPIPAGARIVFITNPKTRRTYVPAVYVKPHEDGPVFRVLVKSQQVYRVRAKVLTQRLTDDGLPVPRCLREWIPDEVTCALSEELISGARLSSRTLGEEEGEEGEHNKDTKE